MKKIFFLFFLFLNVVGVSFVFSQRVENVKSVVQSDRIVITYDIVESLPGDTVFIAVFANDELFNELPPANYIGDIGKIFQGGKGKRIECLAKKQLTNYKGQLTFEVRIELVYRFILQTEITTTRRGKNLNLRWLVWPHQDVAIHLMKAGVEQYLIATVAENGYTWKVPGRQTLGTDYQLRLVLDNQIVKTNKFQIKHRVATWIKVLPLPLVALAFIATEKAQEDKLPGPPGLGLN